MPVSVATFKEHFPEFVQAPDTLVQAKINEALVTHKPPIWEEGDVKDQAVMYKAASFLALSPGAKHLRMSDPNSSDTIYDKRWMELARSVAFAYRVVQ